MSDCLAPSTALTDRAYEQLRTAILDGTFQPGFPLLEVELAERLNMSRTPIRAAIARLKSEGLVTTIRRKGIFVTTITAEDIEQIYEIMEGLEGMAAKLAAARATDQQLQELAATVEAMDKALAGSLEEWANADRGFHETLLRLAGNKYINAHIERLNLQVERVRWLRFRNLIQSRERSTFEHRATVDAICSREGERARFLHQAHWQRVRQEIIQLLG